MKNIKIHFYERLSTRVTYLEVKMIYQNIQFREKNILSIITCKNKKYWFIWYSSWSKYFVTIIQETMSYLRMKEPYFEIFETIWKKIKKIKK